MFPAALSAQIWADSCSSYAFYGRIQAQGYSDFSRVHVRTDGDFLAVGTIKGNFEQMAIQRNYVQVMRVGGSGQLIWTKKIGIGDTAVQTDLRTYSSVLTRNGDIVLLVTAAASQYSGNYVLRMDSDGNLLWQKRLNYTAAHLAIEVVTSVYETAAGLLMVAGYNNSGGVLLLLEPDGSFNRYTGIQSGDCQLRYTSCTESPAAYFVTGTGTSRLNNNLSNFVARIDKQQGNTGWIRWINFPGVPALSSQAEYYCSDIQYSNGRLAITGNTYFLYSGPRSPGQITLYMDEEGRNTSALRIANPVQPSANANLFQGALFDPFRMAGVQYLNNTGGDFFVYQLYGADAPYRGWRLNLPDIQCANDSRMLPDSSLLVGGFNREGTNGVMAALLKTSPIGQLPSCNSTVYAPLVESASYTLQDIPNILISFTSVNQVEPSFLDTLSGSGFQWLLSCSTQTVIRLGKIQGPGTLCAGRAGSFRSTVQHDAARKLQFSSPAASSVTMENDSTARILFTNTGVFPVILSLQTECGTLRDTLLVNVTTTPGSLDLGPDTVICAGNTLRLNAGAGFSNYRWQDGDTAAVYTVSMPGMYHIIVRDACGNALRDTVVVQPAAPVAFSIGDDRTVCPGDTLRFSAPPGFTDYRWGPGEYTGEAYTQTISIQAVATFALYGEADRWPGCRLRDTVQIMVRTVPRLQLVTDTFVCSGQPLVLDAGAGFRSYTWSNGETGRTVTVNLPGIYRVTAEDVQGCVRSSPATVRTATCKGFLYLPNAFSPDNNGRNDRFRAWASLPPERFLLQVFDRWGREVFLTTDVSAGWDGRYKGRAAAPGVYLWICRYRYSNLGWQEKKGTVVLLR